MIVVAFFLHSISVFVTEINIIVEIKVLVVTYKFIIVVNLVKSVGDKELIVIYKVGDKEATVLIVAINFYKFS